MVDIKQATIDALQDAVEGKEPAEVLEYLFSRNVLDERKCRIALMRQHYFKLLQEYQDLTPADAKVITADHFATSVSSVEKAVYYYRRVEL